MSLADAAQQFLSQKPKRRPTKVQAWVAKQDEKFQAFLPKAIRDGEEIRALWRFCTEHGLDASETQFRRYADMCRGDA